MAGHASLTLRGYTASMTAGISSLFLLLYFIAFFSLSHLLLLLLAHTHTYTHFLTISKQNTVEWKTFGGNE